jgi:predicted outer membrane repeat protein
MEKEVKKIKNYKKAIIKTSILIATILLLAITLSSDFAATINVNSTDVGGIQEGLGTANNTDTLLLANGTYTGNNSTGIAINKNVTIQGNGSAADVVIDAQGQRRIFTIGNNLNVTFINITFINGKVAGSGGAIYNNYTATTMTFINCTFTNNTITGTGNTGGAVYNNGPNLSVSGSNFINNTATSDGGAIRNIGVNMSVSGSTFINNKAGRDGGAIESYNSANLRVSNSNFINNAATGIGGAIDSYTSTNLNISNSSFINNVANNQGGAIYNTGVNCSVIGSNFTNNKANNDRGGAIYNAAANCSVSGSNFTNNGARYEGGGIYNNGGFNFTVIGSNFTNNSDSWGGSAVFNRDGVNCSVSDSIFTSNSAEWGAVCNTGANFNVSGCNFTNNKGVNSEGGAICNIGPNMSVIGSIFTNNTIKMGGAIWNSGPNMSVIGSNFTNNTATTGGGIYNNLIYITPLYNIINANFSVIDSNFINNTATTGGAIYNLVANFSVNGSNFINNTATMDGGVIWNNGTNLSVSGSNFINNTATRDGGVIYNYIGANMSVSGSNFINNTETRDGGVIYNYIGANLSVSGSNFINNTAIRDGGVIYNYMGTNMSINGSNFINNTAAKDGGVIYNTGVNAIVNYNRIFNNTDVNGFDIVNIGSNANANLNWWGKNNISGRISGLNTNNHYILNITNSSSLDNIHIGDNLNFSLLVLNTTLTNDGVENLPDFIINGTFNSADYNSSRADNFTYIFTILSGGNQTVDASLDDEYVNITFYMTKGSTNSTIVVNPNPAQIGENITVSGQLANYTGITSVNVTVDGSLFTVSVNNGGHWELNYTTNRTGTFDIVVSFADDSNYDAFSNSTTFTVNKNSTNSTIVASPNPVSVGENITVSGQLANYTRVSSINVTIDGMLFNVAVNGSGYWELNYTTNRTGTFDIVVSFAGNENYTSFTNSTSFNVTKLAVNSTINIPNYVKVGKTITIDGVLVDENDNPIANVPINVNVGGKVYSLITDSNGRWSLSYKPTPIGNVDAILDYAGNDKYFSYTNTTNFNVVKGEAIVDIDVVKNPDGSVDVIVTVTDEDGDPIQDYKVNVDLDGNHIGNIVTNAEGIGKIHIPSTKLNDGRHVITVTSDDVNYNFNPVSVEFETQNNKNDTNNTNKTSNNPAASATMKNTGVPILAIILVLLTIFGIVVSKKED